ncbi:PREDICTED: uncharacterized protein LOC109167067 [Ipomoea nil]|uniref:uncharacterized protein LOC109167067 n=1 Tax=Ipomoea nil TaxID=35883 RepID=UPI0009013B59|nr:PREDICTED: uncharacterized protein LOC109167067 [Ipomoea nil]
MASSKLSLIQELKDLMHAAFKIKDLGVLGYFLGMEATISSSGLNLCQRKYALEILEDAGFLHCKPVHTPMTPGVLLTHTDGIPLSDPSSYRRLIGRLLYLTATRPDITFAVHHLSQFVSTPTDKHMIAAHRILRYIKGSPGQGVFYPTNNKLKLQAFSDSDWASCSETRRSVTGFCAFLGTSLISWRSKKQATVSKSSSEEEYRALAMTTCELQWLNSLLQDMQVTTTEPIIIFCDSKSAMAIAENHVFHERTKHIEIDCHVVRERIVQGLIKLLSVSSANQIADGFTKPLASSLFHTFVSKLGKLDHKMATVDPMLCANFVTLLVMKPVSVATPSNQSPTANSTVGLASPWLFDSEATHHATPNMAILRTFSEYKGPDKIHLGDGPQQNVYIKNM